MKKRLIRITMFIAIVISVVSYKGGFNKIFKFPTAQAVGDLSVDWGPGLSEGDPIFVVNDMAPGGSESHTVTVNNDASSVRPVGVRGVLTSETASLSAAMLITISESGTDLYGGGSSTGPKTLQQFFAESAGPDGIFLSNLAGGNSTQYTFDVVFTPESGNEFQNTQVIFDLHVGISIPVPAECAGITFTGDPILGTENADIINGTNGNDFIIAFEGNDIIRSGNGSDCIIAGSGDDNVLSGNGADVVFGNDGNDTILGGNDNDILIGGNGNDSIKGENGIDTIQGNDGNDSIWAGNGNDIVSGSPGNDSIHGDNGDDQIHGNEGNDSLYGDGGNDTLIGDQDIDSASGGFGIDTCSAEFRLSCEL